MVDDFAGPIDVAVDFPGHSQHDVVGNGFLVADFFHQIAAGRFDNRQGLVQFMGHTSGHFTKSCHFTGLDKLLLGFETFGDIACGYEKNFLAFIVGGRNADIDEQRCPRFLDLPDPAQKL